MMLTRGSPLGLTTLLSHLNLQNGVITAAAGSTAARLKSGADKLSVTPSAVMGQIRCAEGRRNARLAFLYPDDAHASPAVTLLLDGLAQHAGLAGSYGLLAEVDELSPIFETLRRAGYAVYGWQRIYKLELNAGSPPKDEPEWCFATPEDEIPIRQLAQSLVPPLVQAAEPLPPGRLYGLVYREHGQMLAYVENDYGPDGIYLKPLIHPNVQNAPALLRALEHHLLPLMGRRVYMTVRSHQAWLENPLIDLKAQPADRQALMVKHLATMQRKPVFSVARSVMDESGITTTPPPSMGDTRKPLEQDLTGANHGVLKARK